MDSIARTIRNAGTKPGAHNPFNTSAMPKKAAKPPVFADPDDLEICDDPIPTGRTNVGNKYDTKFSQLKPGQGLKVLPAHVSKVGNSLRTWIEKKGMDAHVRSISHYPDCPKKLGRVWLMPGPSPVAPANKKLRPH